MSGSIELPKGFRWMPGMRVDLVRRGEDDIRADVGIVLYGDSTTACIIDEDGDIDDCEAGDMLPDYDDPATVGCLLALVREAFGPNRWISVVVGSDSATFEAGDMGNDRPSWQLIRDTVGGCLVAALRAAP